MSMKKLLLCLLLCIALNVPASISYAQDFTPRATVIAYLLNVRGGPSTNYAILMQIKRGEIYPIVGRNESISWWQIDANGTPGWVSARYVSAENAQGVSITSPADACAFPAHLAPVCPTSQVAVALTTQNFEHGLMIWRSDTKEIYALFNGGYFSHGLDTWAGETLPQETPPSGLQQPQMGFGRFWLDNPNVRSTLGWAMGSESSYNTSIEVAQQGSTPSTIFVYLLLPDGRPAGLNPYSSMWKAI